MNTRNASATEEQTAVAEEINRNVNNISGMSADVKNCMFETTRAGEELAQLVTGMQTKVEQFRR